MAETDTNKTRCEDGLVRCVSILLMLHFLNQGLLSQTIPSSELSQAAIQKNISGLRDQSDSAGITWGSELYIRVFKTENILEVWLKHDGSFKLFKTYKICYFSGGLGPKLKTGDSQVPEGFYFVKPNNLNPWSQFHLSFNIGYPNRYDRSHQRTGSAIMVHGNCVSIGCLAMTDPVIEEIYTLVDAAFRNSQTFFRIHIFPFKMTSQNMADHSDPEWLDFWENLQEGYDHFEEYGVPPNAREKNGRYIFNRE